jgi:hypothetical protein
MKGTKQPNQDTGLENLSVNSSRRGSVAALKLTLPEL